MATAGMPWGALAVVARSLGQRSCGVVGLEPKLVGGPAKPPVDAKRILFRANQRPRDIVSRRPPSTSWF